MCTCEPVIRLNEKGNQLVKTLKILLFFYILLIAAKIVVRDWDTIINDFIGILILLVTFLQCHYLYSAFLIWFTIFNSFYCVIFIGQRIQNLVLKLSDRFATIYTPSFIVSGMSLIFYIVLIYYAFQAYKEFKALYFNHEGSNNTYSKNLLKI